ncbi:MAG TPA: hypothetical protein VHZ97_17055 [Pseudonocardiaceae bacterium]|jgi:hypothetical protein|nr:hypothetical protein [Pseudonocardiaceae bacterium]
MIVQARIATGVAVLAALGALTACSGSSGTPTAASTSGSAPTSSVATTAAARPAASRTLQFPNKSLTITMQGYDSSVKMLDFQLAVFVAGGPDDGHYSPDPSDTAVHRLSIAPNAKLSALSADCTGPSAGANPGTDGTTCTVAQFVAALTDQSGIGPAKVHVNAADQIDSAQELYHP